MPKYHKDTDNLAALVYFRDGITEDQARKALQSISGLLKPPFPDEDGSTDAGNLVRSYDPQMGGPVWYIP